MQGALSLEFNTYLRVRTYLQGARGALRRSSGSTRGPCARAYALQGTQPSANLSRSSCRLIDTWMDEHETVRPPWLTRTPRTVLGVLRLAFFPAG